MKKYFFLFVIPLLAVACHSKKENVVQIETQSQTISNDTLVSVYEGWAEAADGQTVLYDLVVLTPMNGGDEIYEMVMTYTDSATGQDTSVTTPAMPAQLPADVVEEYDELLIFSGKNGENMSLWERGDSMLVVIGKDIKKVGDKAVHALKRIR